MAKLIGLPVARKPLSLKGNLLVNTWRGVVYVARWPRKRGKNLHPKTTEQMEWFRQANVLAKYLAPEFQIVAKQATHGTPLYPRDVQIATMAGTLFSLRYVDGRTLHSMATRTKVSESLDVLGDVEGSLLVRSGTLWVPVLPGLAGQYLAVNSTEDGVEYVTPPAPPKYGWTIVARQATGEGEQIDLTGLDFTDIRMVKFLFSNMRVSDTNVSVKVQLYTNGILRTTGYDWISNAWSSSGGSALFNSAADNGFPITGGIASFKVKNGLSDSFSTELTIGRPASTYYKNFRSESVVTFNSGATGRAECAGALQRTDDVTGIKLVPSSGTLTGGQLDVLVLNKDPL